MTKPDIVWLPSRSERVYSSIRESREYVVFPWLIKAILERTPSSVMDFGAGDGGFLNQLQDNFGGELWYYDPSSAFRAIARARLRQSGVKFCTSPQSLRDESIDIITSTAVWMTISTYDGCAQYLASQHRILKPGGSALISVTHPCFREENYSTFKTDFRDENYLKLGQAFHVVIADESQAVSLTDFHWNLSTMIRQATEVGFQVAGLHELADIPGGNSRGASWLCFEFRK